jgi:hypothetical protein
MCLNIAENKLRAVVKDWRIKVPRRKLAKLLIYKRSSNVPTEVILKTSGELRHLGYTHDINYSGKTQLKATSEYLLNVCKHIILRQHHFTPGSVILAIRLRVVPKVSYPGILSSWNLKEVEKLDQMLGIVYRTVTKNLPSFPKALLHVSRLRVGLGLPSLWAHVNSGKIQHYFADLSMVVMQEV